jgi:hypothetical protein
MTVYTRSLTLCLSLLISVACTSPPPSATPSATRSKTPEPASQNQADATAASPCPQTEPSWIKPPEDSAVQNAPAFGHYYVNEDQSIWASAWWAGQADAQLRVSEDGIKVGWFRPAGAPLVITGQRIDGQAPPLEAHVPCCYPTRFQASGLSFPAAGCWEVTAQAAASELTFVVWVEPEASQ